MDMLSDPSIPLELRTAAADAALAYVNASAVSLRKPNLDNCSATGLAHKRLDAAVRAAVYHERHKQAKAGATPSNQGDLICQDAA